MLISVEEGINTLDLSLLMQNPLPDLNQPDSNGRIILQEGYIQTDGDILAGSFYNPSNNTYWGYYKITDDRYYIGLKSDELTKQESRDFVEFSIPSFSDNVFLDIFNKTRKDLTEISPDFTRNKLTMEEYHQLHEYAFSNKRYSKVVKKHENSKSKILNSYLSQMRGFTTIEYPFKLYICGNDDTSFSLTFENLDFLNNFLNTISENPVKYKTFDTQMIFTN